MLRRWRRVVVVGRWRRVLRRWWRVIIVWRRRRMLRRGWRVIVVWRNNAEELGEGNGGANEIGQMKKRPRARAQPSCRPRLYGYQRRKWWQRWRRRRCD